MPKDNRNSSNNYFDTQAQRFIQKSVLRSKFINKLLSMIIISLVTTSAGCSHIGHASLDDRFTTEHVTKVKKVYSVLSSPNGKHTAYLLFVPRKPLIDPNGPGYTELHIIDESGTDKPFITGKVSIRGIAWKPDSSGISFLSKRGKDKNVGIYFIPVDGGEARRIVSHEESISSYSWHPSENRVAFISKQKKEKSHKDMVKKGFNQEVVEEMSQPSLAWITDIKEYGKENTPNKQFIELGEWSASSVKFAGEKRLIVSAAPSPRIDDYYMKRRLHIVDAKTLKVQRKLKTAGKLGQFVASPDGRAAAVIVGLDINDPRDGRLMIANLENGDVKIHFANDEFHVDRVEWINNSKLVALISEGTKSRLKTFSKKGDLLETIYDKDTIISSISLPKAGDKIVLSGHTPTHPPEAFYISTKANSKLTRLTKSNPWLSKLRLAKQETIRYRARDGLELEGILIHPLTKTKKPAPLIVSVHGGPESHIRDGWLTAYSLAGQFGAAEGFAIFYPNYRGSTGRGVKFSKLGQADYAGKEFNDIIDGIDFLVSKGIADKNKVGVTGGSYGGFASAWMATKHTKRFAASVMFVGISDQVSKFGTTDIPNEMFLVHSRKWPWDDWNFFRERSPITYVEQARTPILIMHGKNDTRVHPTQSMELFRYLKTLGKTPVRLVLYPGEGHGNRKAAGQYDYSLRLMRWMKHYLQGEGGAPPPHKLDYSAVKPAKQDDDAKKE